MKIIVSTEAQFRRRDTVGVYLPNKSLKENWRLPRDYARELRNMGMASFTNHAKDIRLGFTPDPRDIISASPLPQPLGLNHRKLWNGVTVRSPKRTKIKIDRGIEYCSCATTNFVPPGMKLAAQHAQATQ